MVLPAQGAALVLLLFRCWLHALRAASDVNAAALRRELDGVAAQVEEDLL
jgi:hypothetical protein